MNKFILLLLLSGSCFAGKFECIKDEAGDWGCDLYRMSVPHGWLVSRYQTGITFYPDENHEWK